MNPEIAPNERLSDVLDFCNTRNKLRPVFLYFAQNGQYTKIGIAQDPAKRVEHMQGGNPCEISLVRSLPCADARRVERYLHDHLRQYHVRGEWFELPPDLLSLAEKCATGEELATHIAGDAKTLDAWESAAVAGFSKETFKAFAEYVKRRMRGEERQEETL